MMRVQDVVVFVIAAVVLVAAAELVFWALDRVILGNG
jgi:hypothetical protein